MEHKKDTDKIDVEKRVRLRIKALLCMAGILVLLFAAMRNGIHTYNPVTPQSTNLRVENADFYADSVSANQLLRAEEEAQHKVNTEYIRVLIQNDNYGGQYHESITLSCDTGYHMVYGNVTDAVSSNLPVSGGDISANDYNNALIQESYEANEEVTITSESVYFQNSNSNGKVYIIPNEDTGKIVLHSLKRSQGTPSYRGIMEIRCTGEGLVVINELLLEEYLYAVIPSEMPANYPLEALKAQAICARTYAYANIYSPGLPQFDAHVDDSTGFQVYNNITEQESTNMAVQETVGQILYMGDELANTYYYSTSCGFGSDEHVWKSQVEVELPHISAKPINPNPEANDTPQNICEESVFQDFILNVHASDFECEEPWYRWTYTVTDMKEERILEILQSRYAANPRLVLQLQDGAYISCKPETLGEVKHISVIRRNSGGVADELVIEGSEATYKVISELFIRYVLCDGITPVERQDGSQVDMNSLLPSGFFVIELNRDEEKVIGYTLRGGGFGHGAGMSQNGAKNMAECGYTATEILEFFFTGTEVRKAGEDGL